MLRGAIQTILLWYARRVPYHPYKQQISKRLRQIFEISLAGEYVETRGGLRWAMDAADYTQQDIFWSGAKDPAEIREALRCMPKGSVMFDLGANFGYYAITLASALQGDCRIYAFEPNRNTMQRLEKNVALNGTRGLHLLEVGLSDTRGQAFVVETPAHSGAAYLSQTPISGPCNPASVPVTTIDLFCEQQNIHRLDLVKMDIEGAELRALRGGVAAFKRLQPALLIELNPETSERAGYSVRDLVVFLEDLGYAIYNVRSRARITRDHLPAQRHSMNVICRMA
jgi:FkbM family methyltransferase